MKCNSKTAGIIYPHQKCVGKLRLLYMRFITYLLISEILKSIFM